MALRLISLAKLREAKQTMETRAKQRLLEE
jgi:hypothetical protein